MANSTSSSPEAEPWPQVRFEDVYKSFGNATVLRGLNLDVASGERISIIGPSGSGKTTVLRILMTLERPDSGHVYLEGQHLWHMEGKNGKLVPANERHLRQLRGRIGMVFQHFYLFPHRKVLENITEAPIRVNKVPKEQARARARNLLDMVGLKDKADAWPSSLSGGQRQRVAIARALAMDPEVLLLDEVTSALDPELVGEVLSILRDLAEDTDISMLIVTHEMGFARDVSHRVLFLDGGVIVEEGAPERIFTAPETERCQRFLQQVLDHRAPTRH